MRQRYLRPAASGSLLVAVAIAVGCGSSASDIGSNFGNETENKAPTLNGGDASSDATAPTFGGDAQITNHGPYADFSQTAVVDADDAGSNTTPSNAAALFGPTTAAAGDAGGGGPCLVEPEIGSLYPNNWLRPRFHWIAPSDENIFELRVHAANQTNDLVVYTTATSWTMPAAMWTALSLDSQDVAMTVTITGASYTAGASTLSGVAVGSSGSIGIAPAAAPGAIVYWTTSGGTALKGFKIGDENVGTVMVPSQLKEQTTDCVGCHTSSPDGLFVGLTTNNNWNNSIGSVQANIEGTAPSFLGSAASTALLAGPRGIGSFSAAHWATGDHVTITTVNDKDIGWVDLEATDPSRTGDPSHGGAPTWSHDGKTITYVSTNAITTGRLGDGAADLFQIPYNDRAGGTATPVTGAADPNFEEYYPVYSSDDAMLAFDRIAITKGVTQNMYNQPAAEVYVIPSKGGTATRLAANDPPACTGKASPGVTNSWPKWSPAATTTADGRTFYWAVFSSTRDEGSNPQLYVTPVVVDRAGKVTTYQALYLWNQPADENNHTPAWDIFQIPPTPPPSVK
jgi:hypothetical protein